MRTGAALAVGLALAAPALAFVPSAERLVDAAARSNAEAKRALPLRLEVALLTAAPDAGDEEPIATGELVSEPGGVLRLELVGRNGVRERHEASAGRRGAWRDGEPLAEPRALLPPLPLLQTTAGAALRASLRQLGVSVEEAGMGRSGEHDCFVVGGREPGVASEQSWRPALWLDAYSFEIVRVDRGDARFRFGPTRAFGAVRVPAWVALEEPGKSPLYLEIRAAAPLRTPAAR